jgi:hypothetical protein
MSFEQDSNEVKTDNAEHSIQDSQPENEEKNEEITVSFVEPLFREWEYCIKDDLVVSSVNNGIEERFMYYYSQPAEPQHNEVIELDIENGHDFSFKQEENRVITEGNLNINEEVSKIQPEIMLSPIEEKNEENSVILEKNENDYMTDEFLNDGEFSQRSHKSNISNTKEEFFNNQIVKEPIEVAQDIKLQNEKSENFENTKIDEQDKKINEVKLDLNPQINDSQIIENLPVQQIIENKVFDISEPSEVMVADEKIEKSTEPQDLQYSKLEGNNERLLKNKEDEIKKLNSKLNTQKFQNKLIMDENKKLLEVISIFKMLQNLEAQSPFLSNSNYIKF